MPNIVSLGAEHGVTGSCHLLRTKGLNILVDCGIAQGGDRVSPIDSWPVSPSDIDFLFITHGHVDHIGRMPELVRSGFHGQIICTHPTKLLLGPMLEDAMGLTKIEESDLVKLSEEIDRLSWGFEHDQTFDLKNGVRFRFRRAGHIIGSSFIYIETQDPPWSVVFSGDIGARNRPIMPDPDPLDPCNLLILESTYGDSLHEKVSNRVEKLGAVLTGALSDGGKVLIPAFALGRTQEILYEIDRLYSDRKLQESFPALNAQPKIPVFVDSPLALQLTKIYSNLSEYWGLEARRILKGGDHPLDFKGLYGVRVFHDHVRLLEIPGPAIIIAGSGMCSGGRIVDHLKAGLDDPKNDIIFVGYQAEGTTGRDILQFAKKPGGYVSIDGETHHIRARVHFLPGYSAHADQKELVEWVQSAPDKPQEIRLVHGDPPAQKALAEKLKALGYRVA
ncbi:MAG: MBL fold metallo-hydrolase [Pseudomonadota bacterium]